jgi:hypothetical protein
MRAVVRVRREVAEARRVRKCMVVGGSGLFRNGWMGWCEEVFSFGMVWLRWCGWLLVYGGSSVIKKERKPTKL